MSQKKKTCKLLTIFREQATSAFSGFRVGAVCWLTKDVGFCEGRKN